MIGGPIEVGISGAVGATIGAMIAAFSDGHLGFFGIAVTAPLAATAGHRAD
jgi:hypothetical protein